MIRVQSPTPPRATSAAQEDVDMTGKVKPIPDGYHSVTPAIVVKGAAKAIEFYQRAFGAEEMHRMTMPNGHVMHAEIRIGNSRIMMSDEFPDMGVRSPETLGGSAGSLNIYLEDVDAACKRATDAGATVEMPPMDMFWGDRYAKIRDPFGHGWGLLTHKEDVTPEETERRGIEAMKAWQKPGGGE